RRAPPVELVELLLAERCVLLGWQLRLGGLEHPGGHQSSQPVRVATSAAQRSARSESREPSTPASSRSIRSPSSSRPPPRYPLSVSVMRAGRDMCADRVPFPTASGDELPVRALCRTARVRSVAAGGRRGAAA